MGGMMSMCVCMSESAWSVQISVYVHELYEHLVQYHSGADSEFLFYRPAAASQPVC